MASQRDDMRTEARIELGDANTRPEFTDNELNRAVDEVTADITRLMPRERFYETTIDYTVTSETVTFTVFGTFIDMANKPIEPFSETITNTAATVTYDRDTDYTIDYVLGRITNISGGAIGATEAVKANYTISRIGFDVSTSVIADLISIRRVQLASSTTPMEMGSFLHWGDWLWITNIDGEGQEKLPDKSHLMVWYYATHIAPTDEADGSYPRFLDEVVVKGIVAYALLTKARKMNLESGRSLAVATSAVGEAVYAARRAVDALIAINIASTGPRAKMETSIDAGELASLIALSISSISQAISNIPLQGNALSPVNAILNGNSNSAKTALDTVPARVEGANAVLGEVGVVIAKALVAMVNNSDDFSDAKRKMSDGQVVLTSNIESAVKALNAISVSVAQRYTDSDTALDAAKTALAAVTTAMTAAVGVWTEEVKHILTAAGIPNAEDFLEIGDGLINAINLGANVPQENRLYAETALAMAAMWDARRKDFLAEGSEHTSDALGYVAEAEARMREVDRVLGEGQMLQAEASTWVGIGNALNVQAQIHESIASDRIAEANVYVQAASQRIAESLSLRQGAQDTLALATQRISTAQGMVNLSTAWGAQVQSFLAISQQAIAHAQSRFSAAAQWDADIQGRLTEAQANVNIASELHGSADVTIRIAVQRDETADKLRLDGERRHDDYMGHLNSRVEMAQRGARTSTRQYADNSSPRGVRVPTTTLPTS